jgi:hypothetical protein
VVDDGRDAESAEDHKEDEFEAVDPVRHGPLLNRAGRKRNGICIRRAARAQIMRRRSVTLRKLAMRAGNVMPPPTQFFLS